MSGMGPDQCGKKTGWKVKAQGGEGSLEGAGECEK